MKTLAEIAIEAGLVTKAGAAKAGRMAEERKQPLIAMLIKELGVDEVALIGALRKQTRVPLIDPAQIQIDVDALRVVSRDVCARLRVLPIAIATDGKNRVLRVAMADPTDTSAILELEQLTQCEIEVNALPLSAIDELVDKGYRQFSTAVVNRPRPFGDNLFVTTKSNRVALAVEGGGESEVSVTAQIPLSALHPDPSLELRFMALVHVLMGKGIVTEAELTEALQSISAPVDTKGGSADS